MKRLFLALIITLQLLVIANCVYMEPPYADWAHSHVVWFNNTQNQRQILQMAQNYMKHEIPFGGFNIDSGWATCYNDFIWNKGLFPDPKGLIDYFHSKGIKVMLWATSVINDNCPNFQQAKSKGYLLNNGKTIKWWHGHGAFLDFFNPEATKWWKGQMDKVLDMGVDAWKCDGTDPMTMLLRPWPYSPHRKTYIDPREYSNRYYGTFYNHTKQRNPNALIMARPVDSFHQKVYLPYAPKYVMFSGWVGDQDATSQGLRQALSNVIHSAWKGYLNFGFDIGGYRGNKNKVPKNVFARWAQVGSMVPFMENGGNGLHEPWAFDKEVTDIYRKFVLIHHDLKSFFLTSGTQAYSKKKSVIQPLAKKQPAVTFSLLQTYGYILWNTFLVFPIFQENSIADMMVPEGEWVYFFNHSYILDKRVQARVFPLDEFPIFIKKGSIYPVEREYLKLDYMSEYKERNSQLKVDEIVMVYLSEGNHNKVFYHKNYTDYFDVDFNGSSMNLVLKRFYQKETIELPQVTIRIVGAKMTDCLEIVKLSNKGNGKFSLINDKEVEQINYQFDKKSSDDLVFEIEIGEIYSLRNFEFKQIKISRQQD